MSEDSKYDPLICRTLDEAHRLIKIMHHDLVLHGQGKRFWMWMFLAQVFIAPIIGPFISEFLKWQFS